MLPTSNTNMLMVVNPETATPTNFCIREMLAKITPRVKQIAAAILTKCSMAEEKLVIATIPKLKSVGNDHLDLPEFLSETSNDSCLVGNRTTR